MMDIELLSYWRNWVRKSSSCLAIELWKKLGEEIFQLFSYWVIAEIAWRNLLAIYLLSYWRNWVKKSISYLAIDLLKKVSEKIEESEWKNLAAI